MSCKKYQKLLHLNRVGELTMRQHEQLERHLKNCENCLKEKQKIEETDFVINSISRVKPIISEPEKLTDDIIGRIKQVSSRKSNIRQSSRIEILLNYFSIPRVRLGLVCALLLFIMTSFIHESLILGRISRLEQRVTRQSLSRTNIEKILFKYFSNISMQQRISNLDAFGSNNAIYAGLPNGWILMKKRSLVSLLKQQEKLQLKLENILTFLQTKYPELKEISFKNGLKKKEIVELLQKREEIIRLFYQL